MHFAFFLVTHDRLIINQYKISMTWWLNNVRCISDAICSSKKGGGGTPKTNTTALELTRRVCGQGAKSNDRVAFYAGDDLLCSRYLTTYHMEYGWMWTDGCKTLFSQTTSSVRSCSSDHDKQQKRGANS